MKTNHRRGFKAKAYVSRNMKPGARGVPNPHRAFPDQSMGGWGVTLALSDRTVSAGISNDFTNGNRGMAKAVRGAKKFVRSRTRFHENAATQRLAQDAQASSEDFSLDS